MWLVVREGAIWSYQATLEAGEDIPYPCVRRDVAVSEDTIVIGAHDHWGHEGAAYAVK